MTVVDWYDPATGTPTGRWAARLAEVRDEQAQHPGQFAEVWEGDLSTAHRYVRRLRQHLVPSCESRDIPLDTRGFVFKVNAKTTRRAAVGAQWVGIQPTIPIEEPAR